MAYSSGGLIQAIDYNYFTWGGNTTGSYSGTINNLALVWGVGKGYKGYGQDVSLIGALSTSPLTTTVTATQWAGFVYTLNRALGHQSGAADQLASGSNIGITSGATVTAFANVSTAISTINSTANVCASSGTTTTGSGLTTAISWANSTSAQSTSWTRTATFASGADAARYFFNAGGYLNVVLTATNNNATARSTDVQTLINTKVAGFRINNANAVPRTGTGGTLVSSNSLGYYNLISTKQTLVDVKSGSATYTYSNDEFKIEINTNGAQGSNGDTGTVLTFTFTLSAPAQTNSNFNDAVNVTATVRIDVVYPETTYLANTWGTVTIA